MGQKSEKIIPQDLKILLICLSDRWGSIEQKVLFDACHVRDIGGSPVILCRQNTQIDNRAESNDIRRVYIAKGKITKSLGFNFLKELRPFIYEHQFDAIHLYSIKIIWPTALLLKRNKSTALFCTLNHKLHKRYMSFFEKWLLKRVDKVFTFSLDMAQYYKETFAINNRKVSTIGLGAVEYNKEVVIKNKNVLCVYINHRKEVYKIEMVVQLFRDLKKQAQGEYEELILKIYIGKKIIKSKDAKKVITALEHELYQGDIFILEYSQWNPEVGLMISIADGEPLSSFEMTHLFNNIPVLFPRTVGRQALLYNYGKIGDSYALDDLREARSKLYYILKYYENYEKVLNKRKESMVEDHGEDKYIERLSTHYERIISLRRRHAAKSKLRRVKLLR